MSGVRIDLDLIEEVSARLDLRTPNREAVESVLYELSQHFDVEGKPAPFEPVVVSATGVGKTYILAGLLEYLAVANGVKNFAVIAPGRTIRNKTIDNFTPGHRKSLLGSMEVDPVLVTADTFARPATRAAMEDDSRVKVYIFTVQSLLRPRSKSDRKTHEFQEGLGGAFYEHLQAVEDLVVFADEHHCYFGEAFSDAIGDLAPWVSVGLTATPHRSTPEEAIVYRYPLAAAIADKYVKTPVIVGRKDDRHDYETKLLDGVALLRAKEYAVETYVAESGGATINPVMLVIAQSITDAEELSGILSSSTFDGGGWGEKVLTVHSNAPDDALEALESVESDDSPVRVVIAVGMLKEGWDVKNVYVIASMRASVSDVLTEQTLGRGMRLPWGEYTGIEMLDTLEVLAHERYDDLLKKAKVLNKAFIDHRTRAALQKKANGEMVSVKEKVEVGTPVEVDVADRGREESTEDLSSSGVTRVVDVEKRKEEGKSSGFLNNTYHPRKDMPKIEAPRLQMKGLRVEHSLADITDHDAFRALGAKIAANPESELRRIRVSARVVTGPDGIRRTQLVTAPAVDKIESKAPLFPLKDTRAELEDAVLGADIVPARNMKKEKAALQPMLDKFLEGLGPKAETILSGHGGRAAARLVRLVTELTKKFAAKPKYDEVVDLNRLGKERVSAREVSTDRAGAFSRSKAYDGWKKSLYTVEWFDSSPERAVANMVDEAGGVTCWARLQRGELPILWQSDGRQYNADFIVVETDGTHWVVEVKSDKDMTTKEVAGKREAAQRWANHVNADEQVMVAWRYLLASETDITESKGSWDSLKRLGTSQS